MKKYLKTVIILTILAVTIFISKGYAHDTCELDLSTDDPSDPCLVINNVSGPETGLPDLIGTCSVNAILQRLIVNRNMCRLDSGHAILFQPIQMPYIATVNPPHPTSSQDIRTSSETVLTNQVAIDLNRIRNDEQDATILFSGAIPLWQSQITGTDPAGWPTRGVEECCVETSSFCLFYCWTSWSCHRLEVNEECRGGIRHRTNITGDNSIDNYSNIEDDSRQWDQRFFRNTYATIGGDDSVFSPSHWDKANNDDNIFGRNTILDPVGHGLPDPSLPAFADTINGNYWSGGAVTSVGNYRAKINVNTENGEAAFQISGTGTVMFRDIEFILHRGPAMELMCGDITGIGPTVYIERTVFNASYNQDTGGAPSEIIKVNCGRVLFINSFYGHPGNENAYFTVRPYTVPPDTFIRFTSTPLDTGLVPNYSFMSIITGNLARSIALNLPLQYTIPNAMVDSFVCSNSGVAGVETGCNPAEGKICVVCNPMTGSMTYSAGPDYNATYLNHIKSQKFSCGTKPWKVDAAKQPSSLRCTQYDNTRCRIEGIEYRNGNWRDNRGKRFYVAWTGDNEYCSSDGVTFDWISPYFFAPNNGTAVAYDEDGNDYPLEPQLPNCACLAFGPTSDNAESHLYCVDRPGGAICNIGAFQPDGSYSGGLQCEAPYQYNLVENKCKITCPTGVAAEYPNICTCSGDDMWDSATNTCHDSCPTGATWNMSTYQCECGDNLAVLGDENACVTQPGEGFVKIGSRWECATSGWSTVSAHDNACERDIECEGNFRREGATNTCICPSDLVSSGANPITCTCPNGMRSVPPFRCLSGPGGGESPPPPSGPTTLGTKIFGEACISANECNGNIGLTCFQNSCSCAQPTWVISPTTLPSIPCVRAQVSTDAGISGNNGGGGGGGGNGGGGGGGNGGSGNGYIARNEGCVSISGAIPLSNTFGILLPYIIMLAVLKGLRFVFQRKIS